MSVVGSFCLSWLLSLNFYTAFFVKQIHGITLTLTLLENDTSVNTIKIELGPHECKWYHLKHLQWRFAKMPNLCHISKKPVHNVATTKSTKTFGPKIDSIQKWDTRKHALSMGRGRREYDSSSVARRIILKAQPLIPIVQSPLRLNWKWKIDDFVNMAL
jgi:hypothetical protein